MTWSDGLRSKRNANEDRAIAARKEQTGCAAPSSARKADPTHAAAGGIWHRQRCRHFGFNLCGEVRMGGQAGDLSGKPTNSVHRSIGVPGPQCLSVEGRIETKSGDILAALKAERGAPLLAIDVAAAKARLERLPWIRSAEVERQLPDTVRVKVEERKPFALWQLGQRLSLIDREGVVILKDNVARFANRPLVVGEGAERRAAEILDLVATEPGISNTVEVAVLVSGRRWNLRLKGGIEVRLPEERMDAAWHRLARMERETRLLNKAITAIDLRQPDRVIVGLTPEAAQAPQGPGEST